MTFKSEDSAYDFYNNYAKKIGFSIRKCHLKRRADKSARDKYFVCSNEGQKSGHSTHETKKERASTRSCEARVQFYVSKEDIWIVQKVVLNHNHTFVSPDKTHMIRSQRCLLQADKYIMKNMRGGIGPTGI
jgi:hypothetical protein